MSKVQNPMATRGGENTKLFHAFVSQRRRRNCIEKLVNDQGKDCITKELIEEEVTSSYHKLFQSSLPTHCEDSLAGLSSTISSSMNQRVTKLVEDSEIKKALFDMNPNKTPGQDGMSHLFFQKCWKIVSKNICVAVREFFGSSKMLKAINHTLITLIPKVKNPTSIAHYRPISLCNVVYKIISKILAERLKHCLPKCINECQLAFIQGRQILDNIVIAHEWIHTLNQKRKGNEEYMAIKLDMSKTYDRVE